MTKVANDNSGDNNRDNLHNYNEIEKSFKDNELEKLFKSFKKRHEIDKRGDNDSEK